MGSALLDTQQAGTVQGPRCAPDLLALGHPKNVTPQAVFCIANFVTSPSLVQDPGSTNVVRV